MLGKKEDNNYEVKKQLILQQVADRLKRDSDWLCVGVYGNAKTCKTSLALDTTKKVCVLDFDNGAERTWRAGYECDEKIEIFVPMVYDE